jgi:hypothetical protein
MLKFSDLKPSQLYFGLYKGAMPYLFYIIDKYNNGSQMAIHAWTNYGENVGTLSIAYYQWPLFKDWTENLKPFAKMSRALKHRQIRIIW